MLLETRNNSSCIIFSFVLSCVSCNICIQLCSLIIPFLRLGESITGGSHFPLTSDALKKVFTGEASQELLFSIFRAVGSELTLDPFFLLPAFPPVFYTAHLCQCAIICMLLFVTGSFFLLSFL